MEGLDIGDSVSNITRRNADLLADIGVATHILARYAHSSLQHASLPPEHALAVPGSGLIFHYWGYNGLLWMLDALRGPKAMHYHNITPPHFFPSDTALYHNTARGYEQLRQIVDRFDLVIGDSRYNIAELAPFMAEPRPSLAIYPAIDAGEIRTQPFDHELLAALQKPNQINILFVGRVVRNKRQDLLLRMFDYYYREVNRQGHLWLVGDDTGDTLYRAELERLREALPSRDHIHFTGKVSEPVVHAYYRAAHTLVSASEHEGFGMPLAQAMALDVPVLAFAAAAVPETMGDAGLLITRWDNARVAELLHLALTDAPLRQWIVRSQRENLLRFSAAATRERLAAVVQYLRDGALSSFFEPTNTIGRQAQHNIVREDSAHEQKA